MKPIRPHPDHHDLHGITVVVETSTVLYVGRCHDVDERNVYLVDSDEHALGDAAATQRYLDTVAKFGHWHKHARLAVPRAQVVSLERLGDLCDRRGS